MISNIDGPIFFRLIKTVDTPFVIIFVIICISSKLALLVAILKIGLIFCNIKATFV